MQEDPWSKKTSEVHSNPTGYCNRWRRKQKLWIKVVIMGEEGPLYACTGDVGKWMMQNHVIGQKSNRLSA